MLEYLDLLDRSWLLFFNGHHSPLFDVVFWQISKHLVWIPLYVLIVIVLFKRFGVKEALLILGLLAVTVGLADFISVHCFKNVFCRFRPTHNPAIEHIVHVVREYRGGDYGFISSHAANTMAAAVCLAFFIRRRWFSITVALWALLVGYSRIYLGVHYPFDVLTGFAVGAVIAFSFALLYTKIRTKSKKTASA